MQGKVTWYNVRKGYGFIKGQDGKKVFVHKSALPFWTIYLNEGDTVEYEIEQSTRGQNAVNLQKQ